MFLLKFPSTPKMRPFFSPPLSKPSTLPSPLFSSLKTLHFNEKQKNGRNSDAER